MLGAITREAAAARSPSPQVRASGASLHQPPGAQGPPGLQRHLLSSPVALQLQHFPGLLPQPLLQVTGLAAGGELQVGHMQALGRPGHVRLNISESPAIHEQYLG